MRRKLSKIEQSLLDDIVGQTEIAEELGVSRALVGMWGKRADRTLFPAPVLELRAGKFYLRSEVLEWHRRHRADSNTLESGQ